MAEKNAQDLDINIEINNKFGGAWWDTLNILVQDEDQDFILEFVNRLPCNQCKRKFNRLLNKYNFNVKKIDILKQLWEIRCIMDPKYVDKNTDEYFNSYLKFLLLL